ncbi:MAG TPA: Wzz/FepE/Etk N-terminal domain-containing protein, partial [Actinomycetes bacterium]
MDLRDYGRLLRKRWLLIVACLLLGGAAGYGASALATPIYEARSQLFVSAQSSGVSLSDANQGSLFTQQRVISYAQIVNTPAVLAPVIAQLHLNMTTDELATRVSASAPLDTVLINVAVDDPSPSQARDIVNAVSQEFAGQVTSL